MHGFRLPVCLVLVVMVGGTIGCGSRPVKVTGKIIQSKDGSPLKEFPPNAGKFQILFTPTGAAGNSDRATRADQNGSFMIDDVPLGKYLVAVTLQETPQSPDKLNGKFVKGKKPADLDQRIEVEIKDSSPIEIDLSQSK